MTATHVPVLLHETVDLLAPPRGGVAVDCTFGAGGHARAIAERLGPDGLLVAIDRDPDAEARFDAFAAEVACATRFLRAASSRGSRRSPTRSVRADAAPHGPRHVLHAGRHARARLLLRLRRAARHAHGPDDSSSPRARSSTSGTSATCPARCASWARSATPARSPAAIVRARARGSIETTTELVDVVSAAVPAPAALRGRAPGQAHLPGDPDRGERRARAARLGAAARLARPRHRMAGLQGFPSTAWKTGA